MKRLEIKLVGIGGQGVILAALVLARSASVFDGLFAVLTKKYTSDMRGGEVSSGVILSTERVVYPLVDNPDVLIALSQEGCDKYGGDIKPGGILIYDSDLVQPNITDGTVKKWSAPFNFIAMNHYKKRAVMNMLVLGFVNGVVEAVSYESLKKTMAEKIPPRFLDLNYQVLETGKELAEKGGVMCHRKY